MSADLPDPDRLREFMQAIEERIPGGRYITTGLLSLAAFAAVVWLCDFLYHKLLPLGQWASSVLTGTHFQYRISLGDVLVWIIIAGGSYYLYRRLTRIIVELSNFTELHQKHTSISEKSTAILEKFQEEIARLQERVSALERQIDSEKHDKPL